MEHVPEIPDISPQINIEDIDYKTLQRQDDMIHSFFKTTCELYDDLEWDGEVLQVWKDGTVIEMYRLEDLGFLSENN